MKPSSDALNVSLEYRITLTDQWCMSVGRRCLLGIVLGITQGTAIALSATSSIATSSTATSSTSTTATPIDCPSRPVLERLHQHKVQPNETLEQIAKRYGLVSVTIMGMNPAVRNGTVTSGQTLVIPPYNGILVSLASGQTLQSVAQAYRVKPDVLFEVNGCQRTPKTVFVPGVNWSPIHASPAAANPLPSQPATQIDPFLQQDHYPLPQPAALARAYGWQPNGPQNTVVFSSGVDLSATSGTPVYAVADGTVAFGGRLRPWGNMVVLNHARGRQTRYGYLGTLNVKVGQRIQRGQRIGTVGNTSSSALRFELRYRSGLGWVAQDPQPYLQMIAGLNPKPQPSR
jgi:murein DD-endopeptidase MepM/ murein hydrolase activator NlpD